MRVELKEFEVVIVEVVEEVDVVVVVSVMVAGVVKLGVMVTEPWPVLVAPLSVAVDGKEPPPPPVAHAGSS
jgi:hypothetical protein